MDTNNKIKLFLVDDDALFLKVLEMELQNLGNFETETFSTGEQCLLQINEAPDVVILDYQLDGIDKNAMNGLATLDQIKAKNSKIPVIMLSSQDKIDVAVNCMHHKAFDYIVKSETAYVRLQKSISDAFTYRKMEKQINWYRERL